MRSQVHRCRWGVNSGFPRFPFLPAALPRLSPLSPYLSSFRSLPFPLFLFSRRNFLIFKFETFIRIIIVFICQLVISLSLLSLPPPLLIFIRRECRRKCAEGNESPRFYYSILFLTHRSSPMKVVPKIAPFSIITHIGLITMRKRTLFCNISYIFGRKLKKRTFQESNVYRQSYGDSFGNTLPNYSLDLIFFFAQIVMQIAYLLMNECVFLA